MRESSKNKPSGSLAGWAASLPDEGVEYDSGRRGASICRLGVGGPVRHLFTVYCEEALPSVMEECRRRGVPARVIGEGTNLFFADDGFNGVIIRPRQRYWYRLSADRVDVSAGTNLADFILAMAENGLGGMAPLYGIPGSLGGALYGNAGAFGMSMDRLVESARVFFPGQGARTLSSEELAFEYRHSVLKENGGIALSMILCLRREETARIRDEMAAIIEQRQGKHPGPEVKTAGSYFQNIKTLTTRREDVIPAGKLLDQIGAKTISVGGAAVFEKHANILINRGGATAADVLELERQLRERVYENSGTELRREVMYIE